MVWTNGKEKQTNHIWGWHDELTVAPVRFTSRTHSCNHARALRWGLGHTVSLVLVNKSIWTTSRFKVGLLNKSAREKDLRLHTGIIASQSNVGLTDMTYLFDTYMSAIIYTLIIVRAGVEMLLPPRAAIQLEILWFPALGDNLLNMRV